MSALLVSGVGLLALALGYVFYSRKVRGWLGIDPNLTPPSKELEDGVDYVPAKHTSILFGHHFASIAGAAPIVGPVLACLWWGWLPALVWIVIGGIFFGAVHDYFALGASLENKGRSVGDLSESVLGRPAKIVFSLFVFLALILIVAVFAAVAGKTMAAKPEIVIPTFGLIPVAMAVGLLVYRTRFPLAVSTLAGLGMLAGLIVLGYHVPVALPVADPATWWTLILLGYGLVASILPVPLLLQPRDHLAAGVLFFGMFFGFLGIILSQPVLRSPAVVSTSHSTGGWLWPMLFVTVACGAISGFHSLVSSGTSSKQLPSMKDARTVGYGAMIAESALAILAVMAVSAGLYWKSGPAGAEGLVYQTLMDTSKGGSPILAFGVGFGQITQPIFGALGALVGIIVLKTFVMTTLDSATRITRYVCTELFGDSLGITPLKNRYVSTALVGVLAAPLALGSWTAIWPIFGSANQLIAALVLILATAYLLTRGRSWIFVAVPAVLVLVTTMGALVYKLDEFLHKTPPNYLLAGVTVMLMALGLFVTYQGATVIWGALAGEEPEEPGEPEAPMEPALD